MKRIDRRTFLSSLCGALAGLAPARAISQKTSPCWLEVYIPFIVEDPSLHLSTEILLTATCFPGVEGFRKSQFATEHEIQLYDASGQEINLGSAGRLRSPALRPALLRAGELAGRRTFWGSARVRLSPRGGEMSHAGDLFSAGLVRWNTPANFDNVHAQPPAPPGAGGRYYYSMPFPGLVEFHCIYSLFNPGNEVAEGVVRLVDPLGRKVAERGYKLGPRQTTLYTFPALKMVASPAEAFAIPAQAEALGDGGVVVTENRTETPPVACTFIKGRRGSVFSVDHPLHFGDAPIQPARRSPYGPNRSFPAEAFLYTPLQFSARRLGGLDLETRIYFSANRWREEALWLMPFITDSKGMIVWASNRDEGFQESVSPASLTEQGLIRLGFFQSCRVDTNRLPLDSNFSGGMGVATIPATSHSLMKVEVRATNWGRAAFSHFRPGGHFHKRYRQAARRGELATDYIVTGCQVVRNAGGSRKHDCLLAVMNIEFEEERTGLPRIQLFGESGLIAERSLGEFEPLACRHMLLSELLPELETQPGRPLTLRMLDRNAMTILSLVHLDYERRDLAIDHGSDRHSTYSDYHC